MSVPGAGASHPLHPVEETDRTTELRLQLLQEDRRTPNPSSMHCRVLFQEFFCSNRVKRASPSVHNHSSSCDSRRALRQSSPHSVPYTPLLAPQKTPTAATPLRICVEIPSEKRIRVSQNLNNHLHRWQACQDVPSMATIARPSTDPTASRWHTGAKSIRALSMQGCLSSRMYLPTHPTRFRQPGRTGLFQQALSGTRSESRVSLVPILPERRCIRRGSQHPPELKEKHWPGWQATTLHALTVEHELTPHCSPSSTGLGRDAEGSSVPNPSARTKRDQRPHSLPQ